MRRQSLVLLTLLLAISGWILWARWPVATLPATNNTGDQPQLFAAALAQSQTASPLPTTPTPPPPMPTPLQVETVDADWQSFSAPYWGITFQYPPGWTLEANGQQVITSTQDARHSWIPGSGLGIVSPAESEGRMYLSIEPYLLSEGGSLAEWIEFNQQFSPAMGIMSPDPNMTFYTIPPNYLPAGVEQGIYTLYPRPIQHSSQVWLSYNGLVFRFVSTYNRPEDMARIFAILSTMRFTPIPEDRLAGSNSFNGDENDIRRFLAAQGTPEPPCDFLCSDYNKRTQALHDAMIQPPHHRPMMQAATPVLDDGTWLTYTQPIWGISFRYPPNLAVSDTLAESDLDEAAALQGSITLQDTGGYHAHVLTIELFPFTVSDDVPLHNWEAIQDQLNRTRQTNEQFRYRMPVPINSQHIPQAADDVVHLRQQAAWYQLDTFWASKDGVVFRFTNNDPNVLPWAAGIYASVEFDTTQLARLRAEAGFVGDERTMLDELAAQWDAPRTPTPHPDATATPFPTITPYPTATPTPTPMRVTVTPSAFESPLVNGLKYYQGETVYNIAPFEIRYDPATWQLATYLPSDNELGSLYLAHQHLVGCQIILNSWVSHAIPLTPITLAGRAWSIAYSGGNSVIYGTGWQGGGQQFLVMLPDPLRDPYDPNTKTRCELDAEVVFDTLIVVGDDPFLLPTTTPTP